jgi:hypothetical protein
MGAYGNAQRPAGRHILLTVIISNKVQLLCDDNVHSDVHLEVFTVST